MTQLTFNLLDTEEGANAQCFSAPSRITKKCNMRESPENFRQIYGFVEERVKVLSPLYFKNS